MERLINKLLGDYESGVMTRRELIQSLAMAVAVAPAAAAIGQQVGPADQQRDEGPIRV